MPAYGFLAFFLDFVKEDVLRLFNEFHNKGVLREEYECHLFSSSTEEMRG